MRVYFAAPLFNPMERAWNLAFVASEIFSRWEVWLPQRDGYLLATQSDATGTWRNKIFSNDLRAIQDSDVMVAVLNGATVDTGVAVEMGMAHARRMPVLGYHDDDRSQQLGELNVMVTGCCSVLATNRVDLGSFLDTAYDAIRAEKLAMQEGIRARMSGN